MAAQAQIPSEQKETREKTISHMSLQKTQNKEFLSINACYSVTKYYLCRQNNKHTFFSSKQRHKAFHSFPNRYQFSCINKVSSLFSISCILIIILPCKRASFDFQSLKFIYKTEDIKEGYTSTCASLFSYHSSASHHLIVFYSFKK